MKRYDVLTDLNLPDANDRWQTPPVEARYLVRNVETGRIRGTFPSLDDAEAFAAALERREAMGRHPSSFYRDTDRVTLTDAGAAALTMLREVNA